MSTRSDRRTGVLGIDLGTSAVKVVITGTVIGHAAGLNALPDSTAISHLRLAGGGSTDPAWRQMLADVLNVPLRPADVASASGHSAALLAAQAAGLITEHDALAPTNPTAAPPIDPHQRPRRSIHPAIRR